MKPLKVLTVIGTRPEIIRLSRVIVKLDEVFDHVLVHTGQNYDYELNEIFFKELRLRQPDYLLNAAAATSALTIGNIIGLVDNVLEKERPDAVLILGDTNSCLSAIAVKKRRIPIFHMEAGNRCFDARVPEEANRKIVDHLSDVNLPYSDIARSYLINEGFPPDRVIKTGSPMFEVLMHYLPDIDSSKILEELDLKKHKYFLVSCHREENVDTLANLSNLVEVLNCVSEKYKLPIIMSTHPRTLKKINEAKIEFSSLVKVLKPMGFYDYCKLQRSARCVLSDSGTITEESNILGFPAVNIRDTHERPEGMEEAAVIFSGLSSKRVCQAIEINSQNTKTDELNDLVMDYKAKNVSTKVVRLIQSYTHFINNYVWKTPD
ncbi:UDP-N-acetylglucosamine 2-epimerase (non-hydrolyzing) [Candidatus Puniceispirillum sp.]|nr:UDP-N-acetylglucosamine 2-epimerase (non-hydrolyzing) [Candidatus Puniceispirillum sp.]